LEEKNIMYMLVDNPLFGQIRGTFKDANHIHFLLQPVMGGELANLLEIHSVLCEEAARFLVANIVLAFEHLHRTGVVFRDLKPENILIDASGYPKLADFGFAKVIGKNKTRTKCGTPDYMAPEIIAAGLHHYPADWWTLGILVYEVLYGDPPFFADNPYRVMTNILEGKVTFPEGGVVSPEAHEFITRLLEKDPALRLGECGLGVAEVKAHSFFAAHHFDWKSIVDRSMKAPDILISPVQHEEDLSNFQDPLGEDESWEDYVPDPTSHDPFEAF